MFSTTLKVLLPQDKTTTNSNAIDLSAGTRIGQPSPDTLEITSCVSKLLFISSVYLNEMPDDEHKTVFNSAIGWQHYLQAYFPNAKIFFVETYLSNNSSLGTESDNTPKTRLSEILGKHILKLLSKEKIKNPLPVIAHGAGGRIAAYMIHQKPKLASQFIVFGTRFFRRKFLSEAIKDVLQRLWRSARKAAGSRSVRGVPKIETQAWRLLRNDFADDLLPSIETPTMLLWGDRDYTSPFVNGVEASRLLPNNIFRILVDGTYYEPYKSVTDELAKLIAEFICNSRVR